MKILFIGSVINPNDLMRFSGPSVAGNKMQLGLLKEMKEIYQNHLTVVTQIPISQFPREKKLVIKRKEIEISKGLFANAIGFINFFFLKQLDILKHTKREIKKWCIENKDEQKIVICYNALPQISKPAIFYKIKYNLKVFILLADPPIDPIKRKFIKRILKSYENSMSINTLKMFDGVIALNQKMINDYMPTKKSIIIEGGLDLDQIITNHNKINNDQFRMIYSGALTNYSGIINLLDSMAYIEHKNFFLEIYGAGPLESLVKEKSLKDQRINFKGSISNHEMMEIQRNSDLLINPRVILDPVSTYTFPSKLIEYLASGTPTISTKINGLPKEYFPYLFLFDDDTAFGIARGLNQVLSLERDTLIQKGKSGQEFVIHNKN
jgi:glycosyltransferase involved in cell wall biosynthesis